MVRFLTVKAPLYLTNKLVKWSTASCALVLACRPFVSHKKQKQAGRISSQDRPHIYPAGMGFNGVRIFLWWSSPFWPQLVKWIIYTNVHKKDMCYDNVGLCVQRTNTILGSIVDRIERRV